MIRNYLLPTSLKLLFSMQKNLAFRFKIRGRNILASCAFIFAAFLTSCSGNFEMMGNLKDDIADDTSTVVHICSDSSFETIICSLKYELGKTISAEKLTADTAGFVNNYKPGYIAKSWKCADELENVVLAEDGTIASIKIGTADIRIYPFEFEERSDIPYSLHVYLENINDDEYSLATKYTISRQGVTGSQTDFTVDDLPEIEGFDKPSSVANSSIAGDGSTVVEVKYQRKRITIKYQYHLTASNVDLRELSGKYGESFVLEYNTITGMKFSSWGLLDETAGTVSVLSSTPSVFTKNETYVPMYTLISYKISYMLNNGTNDAENPKNYDMMTEVELKDPTRTGYSFDGWYEDKEFKEPSTTGWAAGRTGDVTLYAKWEFDGISIPGFEIVLPSDDSDSDIEISVTEGVDATEKVFTVQDIYDSYSWFLDGIIINTATSNSCTVDISDLTAGLHEISVIAVDSSGNRKFGVKFFEITK